MFLIFFGLGLNTNAEYSIKIQVRNGRSSSVWSKKVFFETTQDSKLGESALIDDLLI